MPMVWDHSINIFMHDSLVIDFVWIVEKILVYDRCESIFLTLCFLFAH